LRKILGVDGQKVVGKNFFSGGAIGSCWSTSVS
jgi:hypothetical protein